MKSHKQLAHEIRQAIERAVCIGPANYMPIRLNEALDEFEQGLTSYIGVEVESATNKALASNETLLDGDPTFTEELDIERETNEFPQD